MDPSEELVIRREVRVIMKKASELSDKILLPLAVFTQVTIHVCCFVRKVAAFFKATEVPLL